MRYTYSQDSRVANSSLLGQCPFNLERQIICLGTELSCGGHQVHFSTEHLGILKNKNKTIL